jgi:hypothetical protein
MHLVAVRRVAKAPLVAKRSNERWRMGLFQLPRLELEAHRCVPLAFPLHLKPQITSLSLTAAYAFLPPSSEARGGI